MALSMFLAFISLRLISVVQSAESGEASENFPRFVRHDAHAFLARADESRSMGADKSHFNQQTALRTLARMFELECILDGKPLGEEQYLVMARLAALVFMVVCFYVFGLRWNISLKRDSSSPNMVTGIEKKKPSSLVGRRTTTRGKQLPWQKNVDLGSGEVSSDLLNLQQDINQVKPLPPTLDRDVNLPVIWPKFTTFSKSTRLYVPSTSLNDEFWSMEAVGAFSQPVLSICMRRVHRETGGQRLLEISTTDAGSSALASVCSDDLQVHGLGGFVVGRLGAPFSNLTASLEDASLPNDAMAVLVGPNQKPIITMTMDTKKKTMTLSTADGRVLGEMLQCRRSQSTPYDHFEVVVHPGVDVVLLLVCGLASRVFVDPAASRVD